MRLVANDGDNLLTVVDENQQQLAVTGIDCPNSTFIGRDQVAMLTPRFRVIEANGDVDVTQQIAKRDS